MASNHRQFVCVHGFYVSGIHKGDHHCGFSLLLAVWASAGEIRSLVMTSQVGARSIKGLFFHMSDVRAWSTQKLGPLARAPTLSLSTWHGFPQPVFPQHCQTSYTAVEGSECKEVFRPAGWMLYNFLWPKPQKSVSLLLCPVGFWSESVAHPDLRRVKSVSIFREAGAKFQKSMWDGRYAALLGN